MTFHAPLGRIAPPISRSLSTSSQVAGPCLSSFTRQPGPCLQISPYMRRHLNVHGHYSFPPPPPAGPSGTPTRRPYRDFPRRCSSRPKWSSDDPTRSQSEWKREVDLHDLHDLYVDVARSTQVCDWAEPEIELVFPAPRALI